MVGRIQKNSFRAQLVFTVAASACLLFQQTSLAAPVTTFDANVSEWDSGTVAVPGVIIPIGGSGQVNGNFVVVEDSAFPNIQIGIRAIERFSPTPLPNTGSDYVAQTGESGGSGSGLPTWNYDLHIDLRGSGLSFDDFVIDVATTVTNHSAADLQAAIEFGSILPAGSLNAVELFQSSTNPGFFASGINPFDPTSYPFSLTITPKLGVNGPTLTAGMVVNVVPEPTSAMLILLGLGGVFGVVRRRRWSN